MEIYLRVYSENFLTNERIKTNSAYFTFVALNQNGKPTKIPQISPQTKAEKQQYEEAAQRRRLRLFIAKATPSQIDKLINTQ